MKARRRALVADEHGSFGVGHLADVKGKVAFVEFFDHPGPNGTHLLPIDMPELQRAYLAPQTRVHTQIDGEWRHGRVLEHSQDSGAVLVRFERRVEKVIPEDDVRVRWRRRVADATPFLASLAAESRRFYDGRSRFVHAYLARATAYQGITALSSASVELHAHQIEAARRVLEDASQRYLLADEVGLGKTIEAGLLIRQHLLDGAPGAVLIVVPPALTTQWRREMAKKFHVDEQFPDRVRVIAFDEFMRPTDTASVGLLVIDEAHRLAVEATRSSEEQHRYDEIASVAHATPKVILLSATPLLQESSSLLRLFHILSPTHYPLDGLEEFERRLANRDEVGTLYANLDPQSPAAFLRTAVLGLRELLASDPYALSLLDAIDSAIGADDASTLERAVRRARAYIGEAYRMFGRMIRTRRAAGLAEEFPVLGREVPREVHVGSDQGVAIALDAWREYVAATEQKSLSPALTWGCLTILEGAFGAGEALREAVERCARASDDSFSGGEARALLDELANASRLRAPQCPRLEAAAELAATALAEGKKVALALATEVAASTLAQHLTAQFDSDRVILITEDDPEAAERFSASERGVILVFGPTGEEGQNLQATDLLVHVDLPWSPNRIEQRLGRFDRFGAGTPAEQIVLVEGEPRSLGDGWFKCLSNGFGVFQASIASLQLVVDGLMPELVDAAVRRGALGLDEASTSISEKLDEELQQVELAEMLEESTASERGLKLIEETEAADGASESEAWEKAVVAWAHGDGSDTADLRFHHEQQISEHLFALTRFDRPVVERLRAGDLPLIPHDELAKRFTGSFDENGRCIGAFRRLTSARRESRLLGPGDPLIEALWAFTQEDDRGRAFATWRARSAWEGRPDFPAFCFDLRVYPDIDAAIETLPWDQQEPARASVRRRAEAYLPPFQERVWVDLRGAEISHPGVVAFLDAPHSELRGDTTLRPWLWAHVDELVPRADWPATCERSRSRAIEIISERHELKDRCAHASATLRAEGEDSAARIRARRETNAAADAEAEFDLVAALAIGVGSPAIEVDAVGLLVISSQPLPPEEVG